MTNRYFQNNFDIYHANIQYNKIYTDLCNCASVVIKSTITTAKRRNIFQNLFTTEVSLRGNFNVEFLSTLYDGIQRKIKCCRSLTHLLILYRYSIALYTYMIARASLLNAWMGRERANIRKILIDFHRWI